MVLPRGGASVADGGATGYGLLNVIRKELLIYHCMPATAKMLAELGLTGRRAR